MVLELGQKIGDRARANDELDVAPANQRADELELEISRQRRRRDPSAYSAARHPT